MCVALRDLIATLYDVLRVWKPARGKGMPIQHGSSAVTNGGLYSVRMILVILLFSAIIIEDFVIVDFYRRLILIFF